MSVRGALSPISFIHELSALSRREHINILAVEGVNCSKHLHFHNHWELPAHQSSETVSKALKSKSLG